MRAPWLLALCLLTVLVVPAEASAFNFSHRVTITGELTDNWSINDPSSCGPIGSGSLKATFSMKAAKKVKVFYSKFGSRPRGRKYGLWVLGVPAGGGLTHMDYQKATATLETTDNTVQGPSEFGDPCEPDDTKKFCGTTTLKKPLVLAGGWDPKHLYGDFGLGSGELDGVTGCRHGALYSWTRPAESVGGVNKFGDMLIKMPTKRQLRKKSVTVTATDHKTSTTRLSENNPGTWTDDVTRKMSVTFKKR